MEPVQANVNTSEDLFFLENAQRAHGARILGLKIEEAKLVCSCLSVSESFLFSPLTNVSHTWGLLWHYFCGNGDINASDFFLRTALISCHLPDSTPYPGYLGCLQSIRAAETFDQEEASTISQSLSERGIAQIQSNEILWRFYMYLNIYLKFWDPETSLKTVLKDLESMTQKAEKEIHLISHSELLLIDIFSFTTRAGVYWNSEIKETSSQWANRSLKVFFQNHDTLRNFTPISLVPLVILLQIFIALKQKEQVESILALISSFTPLYPLGEIILKTFVSILIQEHDKHTGTRNRDPKKGLKGKELEVIFSSNIDFVSVLKENDFLKHSNFPWIIHLKYSSNYSNFDHSMMNQFSLKKI